MSEPNFMAIQLIEITESDRQTIPRATALAWLNRLNNFLKQVGTFSVLVSIYRRYMSTSAMIIMNH